jgi:2-polyprenyl-3-methyl-5-hydroxy-6-metoxy-1,4-benzoquinol methylase
MSDVGYVTSRLGPANPVPDLERAFRQFDADIAPSLPDDRSATIVEIGFGLGAVLDYLKARGFDRYQGIETDPECVEACREGHPVELVADTSEFLASSPGTYDLVILRNVIAHLDHEAALSLLRSARSSLTADGAILVETFNAALSSAAYTLANDFTHRVAYTEHSLRQVLLVAGFSEISVRGGSLVVGGVRGLVYRLGRAAHIGALRLRLVLERGMGGNPTIWSKSLVALARKR